MLQAFRTKSLYKDSPAERTDAPPDFAAHLKGSNAPIASLPREFSAQTPITATQTVALIVPVLGFLMLAVESPAAVGALVYWGLWSVFMANASLRLAASLMPVRSGAPPDSEVDILPVYSVIVALYKEAGMVPQLTAAMARLTYPRDRLEILFALEDDDLETRAAFSAQNLPPWMKVVVVPQPTPDTPPKTKPRALNHVLERARGELVVIYDAEDRPHPDQLLAAARAFAAGDARLACLQAPLRPVGGKGFIARQFAAEYAVQFDVLLPALTRLGLPFPLGGTSNHFRAGILKSVGAWDPYNVTEDADLGLRLAQYGYTAGLITPPTEETPPSSTKVWIPQRTRWIKGYLQTLLVHSRIHTSRWRVWLAMVLGVALSAGAALAYAPFTMMAAVVMLLKGLQYIGNPNIGLPPLNPADAFLVLFGNAAAVMALRRGARRAGIDYGWRDLVMAPVYWCLQSIAAAFAVYKLIKEPFHWDKTPHAPAEDVHNPLAGQDVSAYAETHERCTEPDNPANDRVG